MFEYNFLAKILTTRRKLSFVKIQKINFIRRIHFLILKIAKFYQIQLNKLNRSHLYFYNNQKGKLKVLEDCMIIGFSKYYQSKLIRPSK